MKIYRFETHLSMDISFDVEAENEEEVEKKGLKEAMDHFMLDYQGNIVDSFDFDDRNTYITEII